MILDKIKNYLEFLKENYGDFAFITEEKYLPSETDKDKSTQQSFAESEETTSASGLTEKSEIAAVVESIGIVETASPLFGGEEEWQSSATLDELYNEINTCQKCPLGRTRTNFVFGVGNPRAEIMFVGEAPGEEEDLKGEPFVGRAGQLLTRTLKSIGIERKDVYICNILKCRPPNNRTPNVSEMEKCVPYLLKQIELVKPKLIVALGATAVAGLFKKSVRIGQLRGKVLEFQKTPVIVTYHPAALLRTPSWTDNFVSDLNLALNLLKKIKLEKK